MNYVICQNENEEMVLVSITSSPSGNYGNISNDEEQAMLFETLDEANAVIETLDGGAEFWGARPRKRKPRK
jgi:hypothetical protein